MSATPTHNPASGKALPAPTGTAADIGTAAMVFLHDSSGHHVATGRARRSEADYTDRRFEIEEAGRTYPVPADSPAARDPSGVWTVYLED